MTEFEFYCQMYMSIKVIVFHVDMVCVCYSNTVKTVLKLLQKQISPLSLNNSAQHQI